LTTELGSYEYPPLVVRHHHRRRRRRISWQKFPGLRVAVFFVLVLDLIGGHFYKVALMAADRYLQEQMMIRRVEM
jgi:hypothetical protein